MKWRCGVCGFIYDGDQPPEKCPKCGAPKEKFAQLKDEEAKLIDRSRLTNTLHMRLASILDEASEIAGKGVADNLDPPCVAIFNKTLQKTHTLSQMIKAEIQGHISRGKWG